MGIRRGGHQEYGCGQQRVIIRLTIAMNKIHLSSGDTIELRWEVWPAF
jgi:hypothetical protein